MRTYAPNKWVIVKIKTEEHGTVCKVLGGWSGGYLDGDSWRLSSGLVKIETEGDYYLMHNCSGSIYKCCKNMNGLTIASSPIFEQLKKVSEVKLITAEEFLKKEE